MESYGSMIDHQLPANTSSMEDYPVPSPFLQFSDNSGLTSSYGGNLSGMPGSFSNLPPPPPGSGSSLNMGGTPGSQQSYGTGIPSGTPPASFSMPYDPPALQGSSPMPISNHSPQTTASGKTIHSCTYCGLVLSSGNALIEHKRIHTGDRPFVCHICNKRFTQKAHLNIHKRTHTGEKPYACHICHKRFAQSSHLSSHKRIHTGEKPFVCGICHLGFTQKQRLDVHLKKHLERPGHDDLGRPPSLLASQAQLEHYRHGPPNHDDTAFMQMIGHGMPYVKQEPDVLGERGQIPEDLRHGAGGGNLTPAADKSHSDEVKRRMSDDKVPKEEADDDEDEVRSQKVGEPGSKSPKISAPSFSSEGMFLHPSGYVAYGGIEDTEEAGEAGVATPRGPGTSNGAGHQLMAGPPSAGHRRKPSFVRKRYSESPVKEEESSGTSYESAGSNVSDFQPFRPLQGTPPHSNDAPAEEEEADGSGTEEFHDTGSVLDDKNDPPYHGNGNKMQASSLTSKTSIAASPLSTVETRSHSRRGTAQTRPHLDAINGDRANSHLPSLAYSGHGNNITNSGLVKVNNRISLVNFTAEELVAHLMKRDDVHKCQFCCLIFQDAAMYHIHRNMHDKFDVRRCNMCGKMLLDKYDFTAHFLSMHQS